MFYHKHKLVSDDTRIPREPAAMRTPRRRRVGDVRGSLFNEGPVSITTTVVDLSTSNANSDNSNAVDDDIADCSMERDCSSSLPRCCGSSSPAKSDESGDGCSTEYVDDLTSEHSGTNSCVTPKPSTLASADKNSKKDMLDDEEKSFDLLVKGCEAESNACRSETVIDAPNQANAYSILEKQSMSREALGKLSKLSSECDVQPSQKEPRRSHLQVMCNSINWRRMSRLLCENNIKSARHILAQNQNLPRLLGSQIEYAIEKGAERHSSASKWASTPKYQAGKAQRSSQKAASAKRQARRSLSTVAALRARISTNAWHSFRNSRIEPSWVQTYDLLANVDGEVKHDILPHALELIGHKEPKLLEWAKEALEGLPGLGEEETVDRKQFFAFLRAYETIERNALEEEFFQWEEEGVVAVNELPSLVRECGILPIKDVLAEGIRKVNQDGTGNLSVDEFVYLMRYLHSVAGFTQLELDKLHAVFLKYDRDNSGEIDGSELVGALQWCGYPVSEQDATSLAKEADSDGSGCLCEAEFMMVMRRYREQEVECLIGFCGEEPDVRQLKFKKLPAVFAALGYGSVSPALVRELADECNLNTELHTYLSFDDIWSITRAFRANQGLCKAQLKELRGVFNRFATSGKDSEQKGFSEVELGWALRWIGIVLPLPRVQELLADVDTDGSGRIEWEEFVHLARSLYDAEFEAVQNAFQTAGNPKTLPVQTGFALNDVLLALGYSPTPKLLQPLIRSHAKEANFQEFVHLVADFRKISRRALRQAEGFTPPEMEQLQNQFQGFDKDGDGTVGGHELRHLLEFVEPAAVSDAKARDKVASILAEIDPKDQKQITFQQFLRLMRKLEYARETEKQTKQQDVASAIGFERHAVRDFHGVFTAHASASGEITLNGVCKMLRPIVHVKHNCELDRQLVQLVNEADEDCSGGLDFPEFLILLRRLQDTNCCNINDHSERIAISLRKHFVDSETSVSDAHPGHKAGTSQNRPRRSIPALGRSGSIELDREASCSQIDLL